MLHSGRGQMKEMIERPAPIWAIHGMNLLLLAILLLGAPALTGFDLGPVVLWSSTWLERLVIAGLVVGAVANLMVSSGFEQRRHRLACLGWAGLHLAILGVGLMLHWGWIDVGWFKGWVT
jgi:hypothetical protein